MRIVLGVLIAWIVLGIVLPLLGIFVASRRARNAVPPAPVPIRPPPGRTPDRNPPRPTVTIREGAHRSSHRVRLYGEGTSLYGEAERAAKERHS